MLQDPHSFEVSHNEGLDVLQNVKVVTMFHVLHLDVLSVGGRGVGWGVGQLQLALGRILSDLSEIDVPVESGVSVLNHFKHIIRRSAKQNLKFQ